MASGARPLRGRDPAGSDGHPEAGLPGRQLRVLRHTGVRVLAPRGNPGRVPRPVPGAPCGAEPGRRWLGPRPGQPDRFGREIPDGVYSTRDFERVVSLVVRTELAATHLSAILRTDPSARAMVFCVDQQHAEDMRRALITANPDLVASDPEWVARIVGSEPEKVRLLEAFTDPESGSPVVATTSRLLSTGVDVEDLKFVVLFRPIGSMVEFKQIIGRGTRLYPPKGKTSFEIVDYVGATAKFDDPAFDGPSIHTTREEVDSSGGSRPVRRTTTPAGPRQRARTAPSPSRIRASSRATRTLLIRRPRRRNPRSSTSTPVSFMWSPRPCRCPTPPPATCASRSTASTSGGSSGRWRTLRAPSRIGGRARPAGTRSWTRWPPTASR